MIILDLACLANDEHRQHFIIPPWDYCHDCYLMVTKQNPEMQSCKCGRNPFTWEEDYKAYYDAADKDEPSEPVIKTVFSLIFDQYYQIWSDRPDETRKTTIEWLDKNIIDTDSRDRPWDWDSGLKMRPNGDTRPQEQLFEEWLNKEVMLGPFESKTLIDFVFSSHGPTIQMFRRRGVFVFDCNQEE